MSALPTPAPQPPAPAIPEGSRPILLVDDDPVTRMVTGALLLQLGQGPVLEADDGAQALAMCAETDVGLVLMDCVMPVLDGLEATRRLRASGFSQPVVALSAGCDPDDIERCREAGMDDHLAKPVDRRALAALLQTWMRKPHRSAMS